MMFTSSRAAAKSFLSQARPSNAATTKIHRRCYRPSPLLSSKDDEAELLPPCDVVKGPSLLRTTNHRPRPSLLHLPGLRSLPFWSQQMKSKNNENTTAEASTTRVAYQDPSLSWAVQHFESNWETILEEYKKGAPSIPSDYQVDTEHTLHKGSWDWHSYMLKGKRQDIFEKKFPKTAAILQEVREKGLLFEHVPFGYSFFSTLHGNSLIAAHSAPTNLRLRLHLPLIVPTLEKMPSEKDPSTGVPSCGMRVGPITRPWETGRALLFDDSYDHQVWNETDTTRVLLLVDLWHPDVIAQERKDIVALFDHAKKEGWWSAST